MQCPYCGSNALKVTDTTDTRNGIRRRRECQVCGERFTTHEKPLASTPVLIKGNGNREEFDREKLKRGIWNACAKRPIPAAEIDRLATRVETHLQSLGRSEVSSRIVGDMVIEGLKDLDPIAYIRYAIVYLGLDNLLSVRSEIDNLLAEQTATRGNPDQMNADSRGEQPIDVDEAVETDPTVEPVEDTDLPAEILSNVGNTDRATGITAFELHLDAAHSDSTSSHGESLKPPSRIRHTRRGRVGEGSIQEATSHKPY